MSISITDLTKGEVAGSGLFDELMRTNKAHLVEEYEAGRITGADYGVAYAGMVQATLQQASQFLLQYENTNKQLLLADAQIANTEAQTTLVEAQTAGQLIQNDISTYNLENTLPAQYNQIVAQTELVTQQKTNATQEYLNLTAQYDQIVAQTSLVGKQEDMVDEQILTEKANTTTPTEGLTLVQYNKGLAEIELLEAKLVTEDAQTSDPEGGVLGADITLKGKQADSFDRDAEQKAAKFYSDILSIVYSTNPDGDDADPDLWNIGPTYSYYVLDQLMDGIGVSTV